MLQPPVSILNVSLRDRVSIEHMHRRASLLSLEQRRQKQLLCLMYIYKSRHGNIRRVHGRNTKAALNYSFVRERYNNVKYKIGPYYKGSILWDDLPVETRRCDTMLDFMKSLKDLYKQCDDNIA